MEAELDDGAFLTMLAASFAANAFTALALAGMFLFARLERQAREEGRKVKAPPYIYVMILLPIAIGAGSLYAISS